jgi:hypothetical protein
VRYWLALRKNANDACRFITDCLKTKGEGMITENAKDITALIDDPEQMSLCCLCDQPIFEYEEAIIGNAHGVICLVHAWCVEDDSDE